MSVTQKQIAEHLGVSQSLVALALKDYPRVAQATRLRVQAAAQELGYGSNTNSAARSLRARRGGNRARTHALAVLMGDFFEGLPLQEVPFFKPILQGLKAEARRRELDLLFSSADVSRLPRLVTDGGVDAVIYLYLPWHSLSRQPLQCPSLRVGDGAPGEKVLRPDDQQGIYLATRHLIDKGHRRIAYLGDFQGESTPDVGYKSRLEGYLWALRDAGIEVNNRLIESHIGAPDHDAGAVGMTRIIERSRDITAVVCFNDIAAFGAMAELKRRGIRVPEDISVTGFDDVWEAYSDEPALTTVHFDRFEMGRRAVEIVCQSADDENIASSSSSGGHELLPVTFVERDSTTLPRTP